MKRSFFIKAFGAFCAPDFGMRTAGHGRGRPVRIAAIVLFLALPLAPASGQSAASAAIEVVPIEDPNDPAIAASTASRSKDFWENLGRDFETQMTLPFDQISDRTLQNVVYMASQHADRINLVATVPALVSIYRQHEDNRHRLMALVALHAIGDETGMKAVYDGFPSQTGRTVRHASRAALRDYFGQ